MKQISNFFFIYESAKLNIASIRKLTLANFSKFKEKKGFSDNTISRRLSTIKQFLNF